MRLLQSRGSLFGVICSDHGTAYGEDGFLGAGGASGGGGSGGFVGFVGHGSLLKKCENDYVVAYLGKLFLLTKKFNTF